MFGNFEVTELTSFKDVDTCPLRPAKYEKKPNCIFLVQKCPNAAPKVTNSSPTIV